MKVQIEYFEFLKIKPFENFPLAIRYKNNSMSGPRINLSSLQKVISYTRKQDGMILAHQTLTKSPGMRYILIPSYFLLHQIKNHEPKSRD